MQNQSLFLQVMSSFIASFPSLKQEKTTPEQKMQIRNKCYQKPGAFWHEVDIRHFELEHLRNFSQALGWQNDITLLEFMHLIHPSYQLPFTLLAIYGYEIFIELKDDPNYFNYETHISIPLQHVNGNYYWFTQRSHMLSVDEDNIVTAHINRYTFEGAWNRFDRRLFQCFVTDNGLNVEQVTKKLTEKIHQYYLTHLTPYEIRLLGNYAAGSNIEHICKYYKKSRDYIREINTRILRKTQAYTGAAFINVIEIAQYLYEKGLIIEIPLLQKN